MLTYGNHFIGNNYLLSGIPEIIDITGTNKFIPNKFVQERGNFIAKDWISGVGYFSANNDLPEKYKFAVTAMKDLWSWRWTGGPITGSSDPANWERYRYDTISAGSGYALDLCGYTANINTNITMSGIVRRNTNATIECNYVLSGALFDNDRLVTSVSSTFPLTGYNNCSTSISLNFNNLVFNSRPIFKYVLSSDASPTAQGVSAGVSVLTVSSLNTISYSITATATK